MKTFLESMKKFRVLWIFVLAFFLLGIIADGNYKSKQALVYHESLEEVVAQVRGEEITLRDFAVYVAFEEEFVQEQALIYDSDNTLRYWNSDLNGKFMSVYARDTAIEMAIHDILFYQLSVELQLELDENELQLLENDVEDFWSDLTTDGRDKKLGVSRDDVYQSFYKIACAQKAQLIYASMDGVDFEDYNFMEEDYKTFLGDYEYKIEERVLERLNFGHITLEHSR